MTTHRSTYILVALCGILGTIALTTYFAAPWTFMPLPAANATIAQLQTFGIKYHSTILFDAWLQAIGSLLSIIFSLAIIHLAGASQRFFGRMTLLTAGVIMALSLAEVTFEIGAVMAGDNGHLQAAQTCFDLTNTFIHVFLLAPSLFLMQGLALWNTRLLPRAFSYLAIGLGILFQVLGALGLFNTAFLLIVIIILMIQNVWTIAAAITLLFRMDKGDSKEYALAAANSVK